MKTSTLFWLVTLLVSLVSCNDSSEITFTQIPEIIENPNQSAPLTAYVDFKTTTTIDSVFIKIEDGKRTTNLNYSSTDKSELGYILKYMSPDKKQQINLSLKDKSGKTFKIKDPLTFKTPELPKEDFLFPKIEITKNEKPEKEVLTLFNPRRRVPMVEARANRFSQMYGLLVVVNQKGEVLWYYQGDSRISDFDLLPNGHISFITQDNKIVEIDYAGNTINEWYASQRPDGADDKAMPVNTPTFHHDTALLPNGNRLVLSTEIREIDNYYTSEQDVNAPRKKQKVVGDVVVEFDPQGKIVHEWKAFDHMPAMRIGYETFSNYWIRRGFPGAIDWSHANAVVPLENEDAYLVNFRYQSAMVKVNKTTGQIEWVFAEKSGWGEKLKDKLLSLPEDGLNWHQHSPRFTKSGSLLFFNNNNYQARPFDKPSAIVDSPSYVVEYTIDEKNKKAEKIWSTENDGEEKVYSIAMGRVSELKDSGNVLACYGALLNPKYFDEMTWWNRIRFPQWTMVREYTRTSNPKLVWEMQLHPLKEDSKIGWTLFGAERIE